MIPTVDSTLDDTESIFQDNATHGFLATTALLSQVKIPLRPSLFLEWFSFIIVWDVMLIALGIPGNIFTLLAFIKYKELRNPTNLLICNQSVGDLFFAVTSPIFIFFNYTKVGLETSFENKYACLFALAIILISLQISIMNILALSIERLLAIVFTFEYYLWVTERAVKIAVGLIWTVVITINLIPMFGWNKWEPGHKCQTTFAYYRTSFMSFFIFPSLVCLILTAVINIVIGAMAIKKQRMINPVQPTTNKDEEAENDSTDFKKTPQYKVTKMLLLVVGVFYLSWMPYLTLNSLFFALPTSWKLYGPPPQVLIMYELSKGMLAINAMFNPLIYGYKNLKFRAAYFKLLGIKMNNSELSVVTGQMA